MKKFDAVALDYPACRVQVEELRVWLTEKDELSEQADIQPFFKAKPQMATLFGMFNPRIAWADRIAWEFDLFGDFAADLVVGEWDRGEYCLVEFEDAKRDSVFKQQGKKATREWGQRLDHGYSQVIDWAHKLADRSASADMLERFGRREISFEAVLVIGRSGHLNPGEQQRLRWRNDHVTVHNKKVICLTFDDLLNQFAVRIATLGAAAGLPDVPGGT